MNAKEFLSKAGEHFSSKEAAVVLKASPSETAIILHKWMKAGWIQRQSRGIYAVVPVSPHHQSINNPWSLVPKIVGDTAYYICGWSACEHFGLTEQIFNDISVATYPRQTRQSVQFAYGQFIFFTAPQNGMFGTKTVWVGSEKIPVSDIHKTIVDIVSNPSWGGGIVHVFDCLKNYLNHPEADLKTVMKYGDQLRTGTFFKRLGFYLEALYGPENNFTQHCRQRLTRGYSYLDPRAKGTKYIATWQLIVPEGLNLGGNQ